MATLPALPSIAPPTPPVVVGADRPMLEKTEKIKTEGKKAPTVTQPRRDDMTAMQFLQDAREALVGIPADFLARRGTLYQIITKQNRLRGLGVLLIAIALVLSLSNILA
jgi:hypothetical protein